MSALLIACLAFCAALALVLAGLRRVPESEAWVVQRFGRYARTLRPGWRYVWPLLERVSQHVALIGHRIDLPLHARGATSATGQRATLYYQILEPERSGSQIADIDHVVEAAAREQADALALAGRDLDTMADRLKPLLNLQLGQLGLRVTRCQLPGA
jgi:regulator of protease activity HflC (stomatin/prohibitin superfamily)